MKKSFFIILLICLLPFFSCSAIIESQLENLGDRLEELGDDLDDLGDDLDDLGDNLDDFGDYYDSTGSTVYYYSRTNYSNKRKPRIEINKNDRLKTRKFNILDYNSLSLGYGFQAIMCDTIDSVTIHINEKLDKYLVVKVKNGVLNITLDKIGGINSEDNAKCGYIYLPLNPKLCTFALSGTSSFATTLPINVNRCNIDLSGASSFKGSVTSSLFTTNLSGTARCRADIKCKSANIDLCGASRMETNLTCSSISADLSGTAKIKGNINTPVLNASLSGASNMGLAGKCDNVQLDMSGTSKFICNKLSIKTINGDMSGASNATINCNDFVRMDLSGTSHLIYYGNPRTDINASRAAKVEKK